MLFFLRCLSILPWLYYIERISYLLCSSSRCCFCCPRIYSCFSPISTGASFVFKKKVDILSSTNCGIYSFHKGTPKEESIMSELENTDLFIKLSVEEELEETETSNAHSNEEDRCVQLNTIHNANNVAILKLPPEVLSYILKWIVSDKLDIVSLGRCALVCKDFYSLTLDPCLWRAICQRVWGENVIRKPYPSWQAQFTSRPHVHVHGVYISKTSYIRTGDSSLSFTYKPYFYVEYFRILRFFPNGEVLMLTTPQDPREVVHKLETKSKKIQGLLHGKYRVQEDKNQSNAVVTASLGNYFIPKDTTRAQSFRSRRGNANTPASPMYEYRLELRLTSTSSKRNFNKLVWTHHSCSTRYGDQSEENVNTFDITRQYPALYFNRIKLFTAESDRPL